MEFKKGAGGKGGADKVTVFQAAKVKGYNLAERIKVVKKLGGKILTPQQWDMLFKGNSKKDNYSDN